MTSRSLMLTAVSLSVLTAAALHYGPIFFSALRSTGLKCELESNETFEGKPAMGPNGPKGSFHETFILDLHGDKWTPISSNGKPAEDTLPGDKNKIRESLANGLPLRVTDSTYVLAEESERDSDNIHYRNMPTTIDRVTGQYNSAGGYSISYKDASPSDTWTTTIGHCERIDIKPIL